MNRYQCIRRIHLYLALFLFPWMVMYGLSAFVMNHRPLFKKWYEKSRTDWRLVKTVPYDAAFAPEAGPAMMAEQILSDLELDGKHHPRQEKDGRLVIHRNIPRAAVRLTYFPDSLKVKIEQQGVNVPVILHRLHHDRGYTGTYLAADIWAFTVDLVIAAIFLWIITGIWLWYRIKPARRSGAACGLGGLALFIFLILVL